MSTAPEQHATLPWLTADLPGIGGVIKSIDEDFIVEEIPRYPASGEGDHVFFMIEKRGLPTLDAVRQIARALRRKPRDVGYAGLKDAHGVTRQVMSIEHVAVEQVAALDVPHLKVLWTRRHGNKLKLGHLAGNRFEIRLRGCGADAQPRAEAILEVLARRGMPNYFGPQRFGRRGLNAAIGRAALSGDYAEALRLILGGPRDDDDAAEAAARRLYEAGEYAAGAAAWPRGFGAEARLGRAVAEAGGPSERAWRRIDVKVRTLYASALQSDLFNRVVAARIAQLDNLMTGDLAWKHRNGACFQVEDAAVEQPRCAALEISPSGPLFGAKMSTPAGAPAEIEERILRSAGVAFEQRRTPDGIRLDGARRPLRVPVSDAAVCCGSDAHGEYVELSFSLPAGAYATSLVHEVCKSGD